MKNYFAVSAGLSLVIATAFLMVSSPQNQVSQETTDLGQFQSDQEFKEFVSSGSAPYRGGFQAMDNLESTTDLAGSAGGSKDTVERSSDTNIQVSGVQEPDILKNGGEKIFYSSEHTDYRYYIRNSEQRNASAFNSLPADNFSETDELPQNGKMFLTDSSVIFLGDSVTSYDREGYDKNWEIGLNATVDSARRINESIYLVLRKDVTPSSPCPVRPMDSVSMPCTDFYRPSDAEGGSSTYTLVKIDSEEGEVTESTGFAGSRQNTVVYMSQNSVYLSYFTQKSESEVRSNFLEDRGDEFLDQGTMDRIEQIQEYDISEQSRQNEIRRAIRDYREGLSESEAKEFEKDFQNAWGNYTDERKRQLSTTGIVKFDRDLELEAKGSVPGEVNDQFSISEKDGDLRIATTVGNSWQFNAQSANDLYVLDDELNREGQIQGLGLTEEIYSVRYLNDKAYIVTFRRVDPFHTVDLSDPANPELEGELKLPGYSSYLHPLSDDRILGIGEENGSVKAVVFDVSSSEPEIEVSKNLDDYYSEIADSHHAFKIDRKHEVFFLPGSSAGYVFDYSEGLEQVKEINMTDVKRATYVNDNLYVFNETHASVIDENTWETVKQVRFHEQNSTFPGPVVREPVLQR